MAHVSLTHYFSTIFLVYIYIFSFFWNVQIGIASRLCSPSDAMIDAYGLVAIGSIRIATFCFIGIVACSMIPHIVIGLSREFCTINVVELE